jgi:hypothetical protein
MLSSIFSKLKDISYEASYCLLEANSQYLEFQKQQQNVQHLIMLPPHLQKLNPFSFSVSFIPFV